MKRWIYLSLIFTSLLLTSFPCSSQEYEIIRDTWKKGIKIGEDTIVPCQWEYITPIEGSSRYFVIGTGGKYGVADTDGKIVAPVKYTYIHPRMFNDKVLVNMGGIEVNSLVDEVSPIDGYFISYKRYKQGTPTTSPALNIGKRGRIDYVDNYLAGGKWGLFNLNEFIPSVSPSFDIVGFLPNEGHYIVLGYIFNGENFFNLFDCYANDFVFERNTKKPYYQMSLLSNGYAFVNQSIYRVTLDNGGNTSDRSASSAAPVVIQSKVYNADDINSNYYVALKKKSTVVFNKKSNEEIVKNVTLYANGPTPSLGAACDNYGNWYLFNGDRYSIIKGEPSINCAFPNEKSFAILSSNNIYTIYNLDGKRLATCKDALIYPSTKTNDLFYINDSNEACKLDMDSQTITVLQRNANSLRMYFTENKQFAVIGTMGQGWEDAFGAIDADNATTAIPFKYRKEIQFFNDSIYYAGYSDKFYIQNLNNPSVRDSAKYLSVSGDDSFVWVSDVSPEAMTLFSIKEFKKLDNPSGIRISPLSYNIDGNVVIPNINGEFFIVSTGGHHTIINKKGEIVIEPIYKYVSTCTYEGFFMVSNFNGKFGYINPYDGSLLPCVFDDVGLFVFGKCLVVKDGKKGIADAQGEVVIPAKYSDIGDFYSDLYWIRKDFFPNGLSWGKLASGQLEWIDASGNVVASTPNQVPGVGTVISEGLWDF